MIDFLIKALLFLRILETNQCRACGGELTEHGWNGDKDCMNSKCKDYRYKYLEDSLKKKK